jgi:hypothetical protein
MKKVMLLFNVVVLQTTLLGQTPTVNNNVRAANLLNRFGSYRMTTSDIMFPISSGEGSKTIGDVYLDSRWSQSSLLLYDGNKEVNDYLIRYDIKKNEFEFRLQGGVKVLPGKNVKNMIWIDSLTKSSRQINNCRDYTLNEIPLDGFFEVLMEGEAELLKKTYIEIIPPNFSPALNVGSKDSKIIKKGEYFYAVKKRVYKIKKKSSLEALQNYFPSVEVDAIVKKESISMNKEEDLKKLFAIINTKK